MAISTTSNLNSLYNDIFEDALFVARENTLMTQLVRNFSANNFYARKGGIYSQATVQTLTEGQDLSNAQDFNKTLKYTLTPQEKGAQFTLTDLMVMNDPDDAQQAAAFELGSGIAQKVDTDLVGLFDSFTTDKGPGAGNAATISDFAAAISVLRNNKAPVNSLSIVLHPYHWHDVWVALGQPTTNQAFLGDSANQALRDFWMGRFLAVNWYVSANISVDGSDDAVSGVFNSQALGFDSRIAPYLEFERDASLRATELNVIAGYAVGVLRQEYGVKYTADATEPS